MVIVSPLSRVVPLLNGVNGLYMGVTNHLLAGMILQVDFSWSLDVLLFCFFKKHIFIGDVDINLLVRFRVACASSVLTWPMAKL